MAGNKNPSAQNNPKETGWDAAETLRYLKTQIPQTVQNRSEAEFYYRDLLSRKIYNLIQLDDLPYEWNHDYLISTLFHWGFLVVAPTPLGILPLQCAIVGVDPFGFPNGYEIANHAFSENVRGSLYKKLRGVGQLDALNEKGILLYLQYYPQTRAFYTIDRMVSKYAVQLALADSGIDVNLMNSKVTFIFDCADEAQSNTAKAIYDTISSGEPAVFQRSNKVSLNSDGNIDWKVLPANQTYVADKIQETKDNIMREFYSEIGINNSPMIKRERVNVDEVNSNNDQLINSVYNWDRNLKEQFDMINQYFGLRIKYSMPGLEHMRKESGNVTAVAQSS